MPELPASAVPEHRLSVAELLGFMVADGLVTKKDADALIAESRLRRQVLHPLVLIGEQKWKSLLPPHRPLQLDDVGEWFAARVGLEYYHIDPLKIDFTAVTDVMSSAYATRFGILPVQVNASEIVIATTEPFLRDWEDEIAGISRKRIRRVIASPSDVARYLVEFYNLARSVKKAAQLGGQSAGLSSFEQLVELGKTNRQFDANDQHIVNIVDWLWQYAFEQRASDIHIEPRRELGIVRFRIDGVLHQVYQIPMSVMAAMVSRIKILGRMDLVEKRRPQDGRIKTKTPDGGEVELRLSTLPTRLDDMVSVVQGITATVGDLDKATDVGLALNDMLIASGSSTQLCSAAMEQFRQILSKGKPEMEDWRSLTTAAPGQMDQLAKSMLGPTANANDLYAALGGDLTSDQVRDLAKTLAGSEKAAQAAQDLEGLCVH